MPSEVSAATREDIQIYREGMCHAFAIALHRRFGWSIHVVLDQAERFWEDPDDSDNWIASVVHVYAVDPYGNAWDVQGVRQIGEVGKHLDSWVMVRDRDTDEVRSEPELKMYVGCWAQEGEEPIDRPLCEYSQEDIEAAEAVALRVLGGLRDFPYVSGLAPTR